MGDDKILQNEIAWRISRKDDIRFYMDYLLWKREYSVEDREKVRKGILAMDETEIEKLHSIPTDDEKIEAINYLINN